MDRLPYEGARWWRPRLSRFWIRVIRPVRIRRQRRREGLHQITVEGLEHLRGAVEAGHGVLITSSHYGHADAFVMLAAADQLGRPCYFMVAWQVLALFNWIGRWVLQRHGCFSVDREGHDVRAFRQAIDIVAASPYPLVIFAEGEVYHNCEQLMPFREGAAAIAVAAARRAERPVVCVPAAIRYWYLDDPTPNLERLVERLERRLFWRPRPELPLVERLHSFAEALLGLREQYYLGGVQMGSYAARIDALMEVILLRLEKRLGVPAKDADVPGRVAQLRHHVIRQLGGLPAHDPRRPPAQEDLEELFVVVQLYSYRHDFAAEHFRIERLAELVDKFEEDILGTPTASIHGPRRATIRFGPPIPVEKGNGNRSAVRELTHTLEQQVGVLWRELRARDQAHSNSLPAYPSSATPHSKRAEENLRAPLP